MAILGDLFGTKSNFSVQSGISPQNFNYALSQANAANALAQQQAYELHGAGGLQKQQDVYAQQQALANMLQQQAAGQGPNPALAQLAQTTGQNVANQAALMAGQRGASANAGLLARQASMQGGAAQQQAAGQAATLRAQQQLAAQQALAQQQQAMQNLAGQQVAQQQGALQGWGGLSQGLFGQVGQQQNAANQINAQVAMQNQKNQSGLVGGLLGGAGAALGMIGGGGSSAIAPAVMGSPSGGGGLSGFNYSQSPRSFFGMADGGNVPSSSFGKFLTGFSKGMENAQNFSNGGAMDYREGGKLPGKAKVEGDSLKNDVVPIMGSPGEFMVKRSIATVPEVKQMLEHINNSSPDKAKAFVSAVMAKHNMGKNK